MPDSIRNRIIGQLVLDLATVATVLEANQRDKTSIDQATRPAILVHDDSDAVRFHVRLAHERTMNLRVQALVGNGNAASRRTEIDTLLSNVVTKLMANRTVIETATSDVLAIDTFISTETRNSGEPSSQTAADTIDVRIPYRTQIADPNTTRAI